MKQLTLLSIEIRFLFHTIVLSVGMTGMYNIVLLVNTNLH